MQKRRISANGRDGSAGVRQAVPRLIALAVMAVSLAACASSEAPAWMDPATWFKSEETPEPRTEAAAAARERAEDAADEAAEEPFPNLATVPPRPNPANPTLRQRVAEGLVADRANARYTAEAAERLGYVRLPAEEPAPALDPELPAPAPQEEALAEAPAEMPAVDADEAAQLAEVATADIRPAAAPATNAPPVEMATIYFDSASAKLQEHDLEVLRQVVALYDRLGGTLRVVGHASRGNADIEPAAEEAANLGVSLERAIVVAQALSDLGVEQLSVEARGDNEPLYQEATPAGEAGNRRAVVYLVP